jgi:hypothetical protein
VGCGRCCLEHVVGAHAGSNQRLVRVTPVGVTTTQGENMHTYELVVGW